MKVKDFYQSFMTVRDSLMSSVENQNKVLDVVTNFLAGDYSESVSGITSLLSDGLTSVSFNVSDENLVITESIGSTTTTGSSEYTTTIPVDEVQQDSILSGSGLTIMQVLQDINGSEKFNYALLRINDQLLNYGQVAATYANQIIDNVKGAVPDEESLNQLQEALLANGQTYIDPYAWSSLINGLYQSINSKQAEDQNNLVLDQGVHVIQRFVGTSLLQVVSTIVQLIGAIFFVVSKVLGVLTSLLGAGLQWINSLINVAVNTHFTVNHYSVSRLLDKPLHFWTGQYGYSGDFKAPLNSFGSLVEMNNATCVTWRRGDDITSEAFANQYLKINIDPDHFQNFIADHASITYVAPTSAGVTINFRWEPGFDPKVELHNLPEELIMDEDRLIEVTSTDNGIAKAITAALVYNWLIHANDSYDSSADQVYFDIFFPWGSQSSPSWVLYNNNPGYNGGEILGHYLMETTSWASTHSSFAANYIDGAAVLNAYINSYVSFSGTMAAMNSTTLTIGTYSGVSVSGLTVYPYAEFTDAITIGLNQSYDNNGNWVGIEYAWTKSAQISNFPQPDFISWPAYTSDALKRTLLLAVSIMVTTSAVVGITAGCIKRRLNKWRLDSAAKLNELRDQYLQSGTEEDYNALRRGMRKYNVKAKLFGWQTYDVQNAWFNDAGSDASDSTSDILKTVSETVNDSDEVIRLIRNF